VGTPNTYRRHVLWACSRFVIADGAARRRTGAAYKRIDCINALYRVTSILVLSPILKLDIMFSILSLLYILCLVSARCLVNERRASMATPRYL